MTIKRAERGAGRMGTIISLLVLLVAVYMGIKWVPLRINVFEFRDYLKEQAIHLGSDRESWDDRIPVVKDNIQVKWKEMGFSKKPIPDEELKFEKGSSAARIKFKHTFEVKTVFKTFEWKIDWVVEGPFI